MAARLFLAALLKWVNGGLFPESVLSNRGLTNCNCWKTVSVTERAPRASAGRAEIMISNERPSPYGGHRSYGAPKPPVNEDTLKSDKVQIERKTFVFTLKENPRGRFLRITEDVGGRRDTIIIPAPGLEDFRKLLDEMIKTSDATPVKQA